MELSKHPDQKKDFLVQLECGVESHLSSPELTVQKLLRFVYMSRASLHRKVKRETGMSTTAYKRHVRLSRAKTLLQEHPDWSVYQVALEVGFSSLSYFTKRFKEEFGVTPGEWQR